MGLMFPQPRGRSRGHRHAHIWRMEGGAHFSCLELRKQTTLSKKSLNLPIQHLACFDNIFLLQPL